MVRLGKPKKNMDLLLVEWKSWMVVVSFWSSSGKSSTRSCAGCFHGVCTKGAGGDPINTRQEHARPFSPVNR